MRRTLSTIIVAAFVAGLITVSARPAVADTPPSGRIYHFLQEPLPLYDAINGTPAQLSANVEFPLPAASIVILNFDAHGDGSVTLHPCGQPNPASDPTIAVLFNGHFSSYTATSQVGDANCVTPTAATDLRMYKQADIGAAGTEPLDYDYKPFPSGRLMFAEIIPADTPVPVFYDLPEGTPELPFLVLNIRMDVALGPGHLEFGDVYHEGVPLLTDVTEEVIYARYPCECATGWPGNLWIESVGSAASVDIQILGLFTSSSPNTPTAPPTHYQRLNIPLAQTPPPPPPPPPPTPPTPPPPTPPPPPPAGEEPLGVGFVAVPPKRVLDTRFGVGAPPGRLKPGAVLTLELSDVLDDSSVAAVMNLTAIDATADGFLTAYPCDETPPNASNVNFRAGETRANLASITVSLDNTVCITASTPVYVLADFSGSYDMDTPVGYQPVNPVRKLDTRFGVGPSLPTGVTSFMLPTATWPELNDPASTALTVNVTVVSNFYAGFLTVYPCGGPVPDVSNVNFAAHSVIANLVTVGVPHGGSICFQSSVGAAVIVDIAGYYSPNVPTDFLPLVPERIVDTRFGITGGPPQKLTPDTLLVIDFSHAAVPARAAVMNVTATGATADGYLTVFPCDAASVPDVSNLNYTKGTSVPNLVYVRVSATGQVCVAASAATDVIIDLAGLVIPDGFI
jgi:hypothetical protein